MKKIMAYIIFSPMIAVLALAVPLSFQNGLGEMEKDEVVFAREALSAVDGHLDHPLQRLWTLNKKVIAIERSQENFGYQAIVQTYTFFGIPVNQLKVTCDGIVTL
ncbi:MAG: hypothetical protein H0Z33_08535 [Bacillaceae bacterium]|nr:hypothetical protein [Bacillaceae bacterium]